ncbi:MAG: phage minor capsid protein [Candidatus Fournierella pullistercoris]|uniref:Phage minor capsid protein n=1 Tax=Candidatus Allofournierella pullistercoris TaxID=2838597 RepID=A0A948T308_9FIRM|nr:phage minor capsid protein [Candidatus Fournierella pullistercoris]
MDKAKIDATSRLEARQRAMERAIRQAKREAEGLQDEQAAADARRRVRHLQKQLKEFVNTHGDMLRRDPWRERYDGVPAQLPYFGRGSGGEWYTEGQTERKLLATIDPTNKKLVEMWLDAFCKQYASSPVENMLVITKNGEVHFMTDNNPRGVDCSYLGDKLKGSWNIHTHPPDSTQFSFSTDADIPAFFEDGSAVMEAVDYKYRYRFERPEGITWEMWDKVRSDVEDCENELIKQYGLDFDTYEENRQHAIIQETCKRLGIDTYSRRKLK